MATCASIGRVLEGGRALDPLFRLAAGVVRPPIKVWFNWRFEGVEHVPEEGPLLVAANHVSYLDPFAHGYFLWERGRRPRFLAKQELFEIPVLASILRGLGQIPVRRGGGGRQPLTMGEQALRRGDAVVVYPEGTVTTNPDFTPMRGKTGLARLAFATGVAATPIAVWGGQHVWQKAGPKSMRFGRPIWVKAGPSVDLGEFGGRADDIDALREATERVMEALRVLVEDLRDRYPRRWT